MKWGLFFFVLSLLAGLLGFGRVPAVTANLAKATFFGSLVMFLIVVAVEILQVK